MARLMSVSLTEPQVRARTKTVTRRMGWSYLRPGDRLTLCRKVMGRRNGEPLVRICDVEVVEVSRERLMDIMPHEVISEGFPYWLPGDFIDFFCSTHKGCQPWSQVTRIEWRYLEPDLTLDAEPACCGAFTSDDRGCACSTGRAS